MGERVQATLVWQLFTDCPKCSALIDLTDPEYGSEGYVLACIFANAWDKPKRHEVECGKCGHEFEIEVEY